jgi:hypothetical protein
MRRSLRVPALILLMLLALTLPSLLGCACGGFSLVPLVSTSGCIPPRVTPTISGTPVRATMTPTHTHP